VTILGLTNADLDPLSLNPFQNWNGTTEEAHRKAGEGHGATTSETQ
jgi:hypothetical protein